MSVFDVFVRINGHIKVDLTVEGRGNGNHHGRGGLQKVSVQSTAGVENDSDVVHQIDVAADGSNLIEFIVDVNFLSADSIQESTNSISLFYFLGGEDAEDLRERAVVLPFVSYSDPKELASIANNRDGWPTNSAQDLKVQSPKGRKYLPTSVVFWISTGILIVGLLACLAVDLNRSFLHLNSLKKGTKLSIQEVETQQRSWLKWCFDWNAILLFTPSSVLSTAADVIMMIVLSKIDPVVYSVLNQLRFIVSASLSALILKRKYTLMQWNILIALTLMAVAFVVGDSSGGFSGSSVSDATLFYYMLTFLRVFVCTMSNIECERLFPKAPAPYLVQSVWFALSKVPIVAASVFLLSWLDDDLNVLKHGFYGGYDFGWDYRTVVVAVFFVFSTLTCNFCVKVISTLVTNICSASSVLVVFVFHAIIISVTPSVQKIIIFGAIVVTVGLYTLSKNYIDQRKQLAKAAE